MSGPTADRKWGPSFQNRGPWRSTCQAASSTYLRPASSSRCCCSRPQQPRPPIRGAFSLSSASLERGPLHDVCTRPGLLDGCVCVQPGLLRSRCVHAAWTPAFVCARRAGGEPAAFLLVRSASIPAGGLAGRRTPSFGTSTTSHDCPASVADSSSLVPRPLFPG